MLLRRGLFYTIIQKFISKQRKRYFQQNLGSGEGKSILANHCLQARAGGALVDLTQRFLNNTFGSG